MQYNSWLYLFPFLGGSVLLYYLIPVKHRWKILLFSSILFYLISARYLIFFVAFSTFTVYAAALHIEGKKRAFKEIRSGLEKSERKKYKKGMESEIRRVVLIAAFLNFAVLIFFKYFNFIGENLNQLFLFTGNAINIPRLKLFVPLGISFYTLSAVSYVTDVGRGMCTAEKSYFRLLLFLLFFPVITEGPIERYGVLGVQLRGEHSFDYKSFCFGCQLIIWGLFQKVVLSDRVNLLVSNVFSHHQKYSGLPVITGLLLYTFQLYMDFSGCIDIARGSAELFGIHLTKNFKRPFCAASVNEFWRRWHITLGAWLKDYIFYPVSLSKPFQRLSKACRKRLPGYYAATFPAIFALFAVWLTNGVWHGAEWKYIFYGLYYYIIMVSGMLLEPLFATLCSRLSLHRESRGFHLFQQIRTFIFVNIGMLIFRAKDLPTAFAMLRSVFIPYRFKTGYFQWLWVRGNLRKYELLLIVGSILFLYIYGRYKEKGGQLREAIAKKALPIRWSVYLVAILTVVMAGAYGPGFGIVDFIYARF